MPNPSTPGPVILIVDDDTNNLRLLGLILRDAGYEALAVRDPERVLPVVIAKSPDLVLLDISMPKLSGYEVCRQILAEPGHSRTPVIFLTARSESEDVQRGFKAGAVDYVTKPFNKVELLERIKNHLDRCRYERSLAHEKERFRLITESVAEAFMLLDGDLSGIDYVSPAFLRIFGFPMPERIPTLDFLAPYLSGEDIARIRNLVVKGGREHVVGNLQFRITRPDGVQRWAWLRTAVAELAGVPKLIVVIADITDQKLAELQIMKAHEVAARLAGETQKSLSTHETRLAALGIDAGLVSLPCKSIDGDFFDLFINRETVDIVVGDVMGKGIHAALIGSGARTWFLRARFNFGTGRTGLPTPAAMVTHVDRAMTPHLIGLNSFFSAQYIRVCRKDGYLEFVDCGHTPILFWDGAECWTYKGTNTPIGFLENQRFTTHRIPLGVRSTFLVYSDGVTDTLDGTGACFGEDRLKEALEGHARSGLPAAEIVAAIRKELDRFSSGAPQKDDVTLAAFRIGEEPAIPPPLFQETRAFPANLDSLAEIRAFLAEGLSRYDPATMDETNRSGAILAANEAASNIVVHGLESREDATYSLELVVRPNWYSMVFTYPGPDFDWTSEQASSVVDLDESGYGMELMRATMYSVLFSRSRTGVAHFILTGLPGGNEEAHETW